MKANRNLKLSRRLAAVVGGFAWFSGTLQAAPFLYSSGDLVLAFRQTGSANDYAVNLGKATNYSNLPVGTTFTVTNLSASQLGSAFPSVNELNWSVAAAIRSAGNPNYPIQTLWVARPRLDAGVQSAPWLRKGTSTQGTAGAQIDAVGARAANGSSFLSAGANNTGTGVVIPVNTDFNLGQVLGSFGNYDNTFQGNVENLTAADFDGDPGNVSRSDLYELLPGNSTLNLPGRYLGYFELKPNGTLKFTVPSATATPPAPNITSVTRNGDVTTVSFTTVAGATYRLRTTNAAGLTTPVSTWAVGDSIAGTGGVLSLTDTNTAGIRFFRVAAE
jgi:hypothetical protein